MTSSRVERTLVLLPVVLVLLHLLSYFARTADPPRPPLFLWSLLNLSAEGGLGTWFASLQLAAAASLGLIVWRMERRLRLPGARWWAMLAFLLFAASAEEILGFHEHLDGYIEFGSLRNRIAFTWVLAGAGVAAALGLLFARFIMTRPSQIRWRMLCGGVLYVVGAVVLEAIGGNLRATSDTGYGYLVAESLEECLELFGAALVLMAALRQAEKHSAILRCEGNIT